MVRTGLSSGFVVFGLLILLSPAGAQAPLGDAVQVSSITQGSLRQTDVARNAHGDFVVGWFRSDPSGDGAFGRLYDADGTARGRELRLDSPALPATAVRLAMQADGSFVAGFLTAARPVARRFAADGSAAGARFPLGSQQASGLEIASGGLGFVAAWIGPFPGIYVRAFGADGSPLGPETHAVAASTGTGKLAVRDDGSFLLVWSQIETVGPAQFERSLQGRLFLADGSPAGDAFLISERQRGESFPIQGYDVTVDGRGDFLVTWFVARTDALPPTAYLRRFAPDGSPLGGRVWAGHRPVGQEIAAGPGDRFVSLWQTAFEPYAIAVRELETDGTPVGPLTVLGQVPGGPMPNPALAGDGQGGFVTSWIGPAGREGGLAVFALRFETE